MITKERFGNKKKVIIIKQIKEWYQLSNGYWLKILYTYQHYQENHNYGTWLMDIVVAKTKRQCNDHYCKTRNSPKKLKNKSSNHKQNSIEALSVSLKSLLQFEKTLPIGNSIRIEGSDEQRIHVYSRLLKYGYIQTSWYTPNKWWNGKVYYFKTMK
jgi:hypothetical protein